MKDERVYRIVGIVGNTHYRSVRDAMPPAAYVALTLAGVGLYGILDHSVLQRTREFGMVVVAGGVVGLAIGLVAVRPIESLFYEVRATDPLMVALPCLSILAVALVAAMRPVVRAIRIDPGTMLRAD